MKQYAEIMATYSKKMQNQAEGLLYFHLPLYAFMDSPAVFSGIGGMCSPPYRNSRGCFYFTDDFRVHRNPDRLFRQSPLSDADRIISFRFRYSIYPYTQTNQKSAGHSNVCSGGFAYIKVPVRPAVCSFPARPPTVSLFFFLFAENVCQYLQSVLHRISVFPEFSHIPPG